MVKLTQKNESHGRIARICIIIVISVSFVVLFMHYFLPSYHCEVYQGIEYYSSLAYKKFGIGFNHYGEKASKYLPLYQDVVHNSTYIDFIYSDSGMHFYKSVKICVGVRYDDETYEKERDKILSLGTDFMDDGLVSGISYRLIDKRKQINGEYLYFINSCSDKDNAVMYLVLFSTKNFDRMAECYEYTDVFDSFWHELHPDYQDSLSV